MKSVSISKAALATFLNGQTQGSPQEESDRDDLVTALNTSGAVSSIAVTPPESDEEEWQMQMQ